MGRKKKQKKLIGLLSKRRNYYEHGLFVGTDWKKERERIINISLNEYLCFLFFSTLYYLNKTTFGKNKIK